MTSADKIVVTPLVDVVIDANDGANELCGVVAVLLNGR